MIVHTIYVARLVWFVLGESWVLNIDFTSVWYGSLVMYLCIFISCCFNGFVCTVPLQMADQDKHSDVHILLTKCVIWSSVMFERSEFRVFLSVCNTRAVCCFSYMCRVEAVV